MEVELRRLRHEKELHEAATEARLRQERENQRELEQARQSTDELVAQHEIGEREEPYSPKTLSLMKRQKEEEEGPYKYVVYALLKVLNNQRTQYLWTNKISGLHTKGNFDSGLFNIEIDKAIVEKNLTDIADI